MNQQAFHDLFNVTHAAGAGRHPLYWYKANEIAAKVLRDTGHTTEDVALRAVVSLLALRILDWRQPVGLDDEPTDESIKAVLKRLPVVVEPEQPQPETWRSIKERR